MYAVAGVGTGVGPIVARRFTGDRERPLGIALALSYAITVVGLAIMVPLSGFGWVLVGTLLRGVGGGINWVFSTQLLLQLLPNRVRGRVFSIDFALFTLLNAFGTAVAGWALDAASIDLSVLLMWMTGLAVIPGVLWALWLVARGPADRVEVELGS
jgi:MFS family permease